MGSASLSRPCSFRAQPGPSLCSGVTHGAACSAVCSLSYLTPVFLQCSEAVLG